MIFRFLYLRNNNPQTSQIWNTALQEYVLKGQRPDNATTLLDHIHDAETHHVKNQMSLLGSISNYHWWQYVRCDGQTSSHDIHVNLHDHLLYHPSCDLNDENLREKYLPKSPQNRIMYYLYTENLYPGSMMSTISQLLKIDRHDDDIMQGDGNNDISCPPKKRRKHASPILKVTPAILCDKMGVALDKIQNSIERNSTLYTTFSQQLVTSGVIQWRTHNQYEDTVVMSDYNSSTGHLTPSSYMHVTLKVTEDNTLLVKCNCTTYSTIQCAGLSEDSMSSQAEETVLNHSLTCMHCRFFNDHLYQYRDNLHHIASSSAIASKIKQSLDRLNNPVVLLGVASYNGTTKLSVTSQDSLSVIHVNFNQGNICFANCQNGECNARLLNKKRIPKSISIQNSDNFCGHINTLYANIEILKELFPLYFGKNDDDTDDIADEPRFLEMPNTDDVDIQYMTDKEVGGLHTDIYLFNFSMSVENMLHLKT